MSAEPLRKARKREKLSIVCFGGKCWPTTWGGCDRGRLTDALAGRYRGYILACAEKRRILDDVDGFARAARQDAGGAAEHRAVQATGYERPYYDEQLILRQIGSYQRYIRRLLDPEIRKAAPNINWDKQLYSAYTYLMDVQEFLDWHETPDFILRMLDDAGDQALALMKKNGTTNQRDPGAV
ncbi:MAG: hypothetical protein ACLS6G_13985, partial [Christensenellales bacterium]